GPARRLEGKPVPPKRNGLGKPSAPFWVALWVADEGSGSEVFASTTSSPARRPPLISVQVSPTAPIVTPTRRGLPPSRTSTVWRVPPRPAPPGGAAGAGRPPPPAAGAGSRAHPLLVGV